MSWLSQFLGAVTGKTHLARCSAADPSTTDSEESKAAATAAMADQRKAAAKAGYFERRRQQKAVSEAQINREQNQLLARHLPELKDLLRESNQGLREKKQEQTKLRKAYDEHVALRKYKHNVKKRLEQAQQNTVAVELNKYAREVLFQKTDDEVVYQYQRKLQRRLQYEMLCKQWLPVGLGLSLFKLTRRLKKSSGTDIFYFLVPYLYANYGIFCVEQRTIFEMGYPAHPYVIEQRMSVINRACFSYPQIVKNEIEYLHTKLAEEHKRKAELRDSSSEHQKEAQAEGVALKFERVFSIGEVTSDYKRMLKSQQKEEVKASKQEEEKKLLKFKIIVEDGELYLQCIDSFEAIFEISRKSIENLELTELLDPFMFDSHRDIINALFEVYYSLSQDYLEVFYDDSAQSAQGHSSSLADRAVMKLKQQYNLEDEGSQDSDRVMRKTILEAQKKV